MNVRALLTTIAICGATVKIFAGDTYYLTSDGNNGYHLANAYYWANSENKRAGENGAALGSDDTFVVAYNRTLRTPNSNSSSDSVGFIGAALHLGDMSLSGNDRLGTINHYSGGSCVVDYGTGGGLVMCYGNYFFRNASRCVFTVKGNVAVEASSDLPAKFVNNQSYSNQVVRWTGDFSSGQTAFLQIGATTSRTSSGDSYFQFWIQGDASNYKGRLKVATPSPTALAPDFTTQLGMGGSFGGTLEIDAYSTLTTPSNALAASGLTLADGARLRILAASPSVYTSISVSDSFTCSGTVALELPELFQMLRTDGETSRLTLLTVPVGAGISTNSFRVVCSDECRTFFTLATGSDETHEYLYLEQREPVVVLTASDAAGKDGTISSVVPPSAFTNAASWSDGKVPHAGASYYLRRLSANSTDVAFARTPRVESYVFPASKLVVGDHALLLQCHQKLTVSNLVVLSGGCLHLEQQAQSPCHLYGETLTFLSGTAYLSPYNSKTWQIETALAGDATLFLNGVYAGTSRPDGSVTFIGGTSGFTGVFQTGHFDVSHGNNSFGTTYRNCHFVQDGDFCTPRPAFDWAGYTLAKRTEMRPRGTTPVTLAATANIGLYIDGAGAINCDDVKYGTMTVNWPLTFNGMLEKLGPGTLALGGAAAQFIGADGTRGDVPVSGKNVFAISNGLVRVASVDALNGTSIAISDAGSIEVVVDPFVADSLRYGLRNTKTDAPFALTGTLTELPLTWSFAASLPNELPARFTAGVLTVSAAAAPTVRGMLAGLQRPAGLAGYGMSPTELTDGETGDVTFACVFKLRGTAMTLR